MEKRILEEINRVREIMGLKLISEAVGPKPRTVGGLLLNALMGEIKGLKPKEVEKKIALEYANIGKAKTTKEAKDAAQRIKNWADEVRADRSDISKFEDVVGEYFTAAEKNALVRNIGRNSDEVLDNYITATVMFDDKAYNEFVDMVGKGETLADDSVKDYIVRLAKANPNLYDVPTLERMWTDIESGQFKYADEAGISVPGRKTKPEEPGFKVDAEGIRDTEGSQIGKVSDSEAKIIIDMGLDEVQKKAEKLIETEITKYLDNDLRFKDASIESKNKIIKEVKAQTRIRLLNNYEKYERIGKDMADITETAWKNSSMPESDKQKIIETSFKKLGRIFSFSTDNMWQYVKRTLTLHDPMTGEFLWNTNRITRGQRFANYVFWNSVIFAIMGVKDFINIKNSNPDNYGTDDFERLKNTLDEIFLQEGKIIRLVIPLPAIYSAMVQKGLNVAISDTRPPAKDELIDDPSLKNSFKAVGDIITSAASLSPDLNGSTEYDKVGVYVSDSNGKNYGIWTYDRTKNKVRILKSPVENAATPSTPSTTGKYENTLDSLKQWLKDKGKIKYTPTGPDSNGLYKYGENDENYVEYKFVDPNTGFKIQ